MGWHMTSTKQKSRDDQHSQHSQRGARGSSVSRLDKWRGYKHHHRTTLQSSCAKMLREPLQTLLTVVVIAIALTLPTALYISVENIRQLSGGVESSAQITVFVKKGARPAAIEKLGEQLGQSAAFPRSAISPHKSHWKNLMPCPDLARHCNIWMRIRCPMPFWFSRCC